MKRRTFLGALAGGLLAAPLAAVAEEHRAGNRAIIGYLDGGPNRASNPPRDAFLQGLRELGWIEGRNITIEYRWAEGRHELLRGLAIELVQLKVGVIVAGGTTVIRAAKDATNTIPIVMAGGGDPVGAGLIASLARPGGNITGVSLIGKELLGKDLALLKEAIPRATRIAVLFNAANPANPFFLTELEAVGRSLGIQLQALEVRAPDDFAAAFAGTQVDALLTLADPMFAPQAKRLADLATTKHWPTMFVGRNYVMAGGLMSYSFTGDEVYRRAAYYVDRILKGAKPGDLPSSNPPSSSLLSTSRRPRCLG